MGTIAERVRRGRTVYQVRVRIAGYPTMTATFYSRREPTGPAKALLTAIRRDPTHVLKALAV